MAEKAALADGKTLQDNRPRGQTIVLLGDIARLHLRSAIRQRSMAAAIRVPDE